MSDWCKLYETELDDYKFQVAISKCPFVVSVWVWMLTECTRHKSNSFPWSSSALEIEGVSRKLNISRDVLLRSFALLQDVGFIALVDEEIVLTSWDSRQSDYCKRKIRNTVRTQYEHNTNSVGYHQNQEIQSSLEERRGEKKEEREEIFLPPDSYKEFKELLSLFESQGVRIALNQKNQIAYSELLSFSTFPEIKRLLIKALRNRKYREKLLVSSYGFLNFVERYHSIQETFKEYSTPSLIPDYTQSTPVPLHVKERVNAMFGIRTTE